VPPDAPEADPNEQVPSGAHPGRSPYGPDAASPFHVEAAVHTLVVARLKGPMLSRFETTGPTRLIGDTNFYGSVRDAVTACAARLDLGSSS
jgi:hypothetical protein